MKLIHLDYIKHSYISFNIISAKFDLIYPDINFSKLSELVEHIQGEMATFQNDANSQLEHLETDINNVKTLAETASKNSSHSGKIFSKLKFV